MSSRERPIGAATVLVVVTAGCAVGIAAGCASPGRRAYESPQAAANALVAALRPYDPDRVREVLGPDGDEILSSGDAVLDRRRVELFLAAYDRKHRVEVEDGEATLVLGEGEWPLPIPILESGGSWRFDVAGAKEEILARRVGRNELAAIEVCRAVVDAEREYAASNPNGDGPGVFARKILSDSGKRNGLYWESAAGAPESPLGSLVAEAEAAGYAADRAKDGAARAYHGYRYRLLTSQGPAAPGGATDYVVDGKLSGGFALLAYPATYGNSGVMTFLVNQNGIVYQRDLGEDTEHVAQAIASFDPEPSWIVVP